jgi:hypothetical protein
MLLYSGQFQFSSRRTRMFNERIINVLHTKSLSVKRQFAFRRELQKYVRAVIPPIFGKILGV